MEAAIGNKERFVALTSLGDIWDGIDKSRRATKAWMRTLVEEALVQKNSPVVVDMTMSPHPVGSHEATLARIARRAVGGKVAMVERGSRTAMVVSVSPEDDGVVEGDIVELEKPGSRE